jgi:hypothetical protein
VGARSARGGTSITRTSTATTSGVEPDKSFMACGRDALPTATAEGS